MKNSFMLGIVMFACLLGVSGHGQNQTAGNLHVKIFVAPKYSEMARNGRIQGTTITELQIRTDGTVDSAKLVVGHPLFAEHVVKALKQWAFEPIPQPTTLKVTVRFWLDGCTAPNSLSNDETVVGADFPDNVDIRACPHPVLTCVN